MSWSREAGRGQGRGSGGRLWALEAVLSFPSAPCQAPHSAGALRLPRAVLLTSQRGIAFCGSTPILSVPT